MNFIHEPTPSSGNHDMGCALSVSGWRNCNFKSVLVKNFHDVNFNDWSHNCSSWNCCNGSGLSLLEKACMEWSAHNRRPRQVEFCRSYQLIPCAGKMRGRKPLWIDLSRTLIRIPECFPANCFQKLFLEKIQKFYFLWLCTCQKNLWSRILSVFSVLVLPLSGGIFHTNSKVLRKYWADLPNEWIGIRARCLEHPRWSVWFLFLYTFSEFHDSLSQFEQIHVAHLLHHATRLSTELSYHFFLQVITIGFCKWTVFNFSDVLLISFICSSSFNMASWGIPSLKDRFRTWAFLQQMMQCLAAVSRCWALVVCCTALILPILILHRAASHLFPDARWNTLRVLLLRMVLLRMQTTPKSPSVHVEEMGVSRITFRSPFWEITL